MFVYYRNQLHKRFNCILYIFRAMGMRLGLVFILLMFFTTTIAYRGTLTSLLAVQINPKVIQRISIYVFRLPLQTRMWAAIILYLIYYLILFLANRYNSAIGIWKWWHSSRKFCGYFWKGNKVKYKSKPNEISRNISNSLWLRPGLCKCLERSFNNGWV